MRQVTDPDLIALLESGGGSPVQAQLPQEGTQTVSSFLPNDTPPPKELDALDRVMERGERHSLSVSNRPVTSTRALTKITDPKLLAQLEGEEQASGINSYHQKIIDDMNGWERFRVGLGRGMAATGQGVKQAWLHAFGTEEEATEYDRQISEEAELFEPLAEQSGAAEWGKTAGELVATAPTMLIPGAQAALPVKLASFAGQGSLAAATQPTEGGEDYWAQKGGQAVIGGVAGAGVGGALHAGGKALETVLPTNVAGRAINHYNKKAMNTPFAQEGQEIVAETGIELSPGAVSGSRVATMAENASRQSFWTADKAFEVDQKVAGQTVSYINKIMDDIGPNGKSAESIGNQIRDAMKKGVDDIVVARNKQAAEDYGLVREMAGDEPVMHMSNAVAAAREIMEEHVDIVSPEAQTVVKQMKRVIERFEQPMKVQPALFNRSYYSRASAGSGSVAKDLERNKNREIASRITTAINQDFDEMGAVLDGDIGQALRTANANYQKHMQSVDYITHSALGRMMGKEVVDSALSGDVASTVAGEKIANRLLGMTASELKVARNVLDEHSPEALASAKRFVLEQALEKGMDTAPSAGQKAIFAGNKFANALLKGKNMKALYSDGERLKINRVVNAINRWSDKFGYNHSNTAPMEGFLGFINSAFSAQGAATVSGQAIGLRKVVKAMETKSGQAAIIELTQFPPGAAKFNQAASLIAAITVSKDIAAPSDNTNGASEDSGTAEN